jgi:hypothetical protein
MFFVLLMVTLPSTLFAVEPDYGRLLDDMPALLEQIKKRNEVMQRALNHPREIDRTRTVPAGEKKSESERTPPDVSSLAPISQLRTDPFQISYFMQQKAQARNLGGPQFTPLQNAQAPALALKGIVNEGLALLEVQGSGVYLVRKGDTLSLNRQGQNLVIKIEKIDRLSLMVKMGTLAEIIVVR